MLSEIGQRQVPYVESKEQNRHKDTREQTDGCQKKGVLGGRVKKVKIKKY